jgi:hypothetical protein
MTNKWLVSILGAAATAVSGGVFAQMLSTPEVPPFYFGVEVGRGDFGSEEDVGYKVIGGYRFHRNLGVELAYGYLVDRHDTEVTALELVAVGMWPLGKKFSILGKLGFANWEVDAPGVNRDGIEFTWAIGGQFDFSRSVAFRATWQRYDTDRESIDFLNIGVLYQF